MGLRVSGEWEIVTERWWVVDWARIGIRGEGTSRSESVGEWRTRRWAGESERS